MEQDKTPSIKSLILTLAFLGALMTSGIYFAWKDYNKPHTPTREEISDGIRFSNDSFYIAEQVRYRKSLAHRDSIMAKVARVLKNISDPVPVITVDTLGLMGSFTSRPGPIKEKYKHHILKASKTGDTLYGEIGDPIPSNDLSFIPHPAWAWVKGDTIWPQTMRNKSYTLHQVKNMSGDFSTGLDSSWSNGTLLVSWDLHTPISKVAGGVATTLAYPINGWELIITNNHYFVSKTYFDEMKEPLDKAFIVWQFYARH